MTPRRLDIGPWRPTVLREPVAPWWIVLRRQAEIEVASVVAGFLGASWAASGSVVAVVGSVLASSALAAVGEVRAMFRRQVRRIVVVRRLRAAFFELGLANHRGTVPTVIASGTRPGLTLVRVWLPAGMRAVRLFAARDAIAEICLVDEVIVEQRPGRLNTAELTFVHSRLGRQRRPPRSS